MLLQIDSYFHFLVTRREHGKLVLSFSMMACVADIGKGGYQNGFLRLTSCETAIALFDVRSLTVLYVAVFVGTTCT